jgi:hypothetical protein
MLVPADIAYLPGTTVEVTETPGAAEANYVD